MGPANYGTDASTSLAVQCPEMDEEIVASLDGEQYVLGFEGHHESEIVEGCNGFTSWDFRSCNASEAICLHVRHSDTSQGEITLATLRVVVQDEWVAELDPSDLGETFWCQENGRWKVWIDTTFTKPATQLEDGPTRTLEVTLKTYVDGQVCQDI